MSKSRIIPQMFDVRPVDKAGSLDWEKIKMVEIAANGIDSFGKKKNFSDILELEEEKRKSKDLEERLQKMELELEKLSIERELEIERKMREEEARMAERKLILEKIWREASLKAAQEEGLKFVKKIEFEFGPQIKKKRSLADKIKKSTKDKKSAIPEEKSVSLPSEKGNYVGSFSEYIKDLFVVAKRKQILAFASISFFLVMAIAGTAFIFQGFGVKGKVLGVSMNGYGSVSKAIAEISDKNFEESSKSFGEAVAFFSEASQEMDKMGSLLNEGSRYFPYVSKISSGKSMLEAGKHLSLAGKYANDALNYFYKIKGNSETSKEGLSLLEALKNVDAMMKPLNEELVLANASIEKVRTDDLPEEMRENFRLLRNNLPKVIAMSKTFLDNSGALEEILGLNGPRKYLFLFQNNSEMRATGGFIGSYGFLDIYGGKIRNFFIDGIYNPDGQIQEKIIPPIPVQKMIPNWTLHDSNWFADFPLSASKAIMLYEKTGGPTVDGVMTVTPVVIEKLLEVTGPIEMPDYGIVIDSSNFLEKTQYEVEEGYEKEENRPKKILSDLSPLILRKVSEIRDEKKIMDLANIILDSLKEKHILFFSQDQQLQQIISKRGWSGELLRTEGDYLNVINTNIGGHKTDAVIEENIDHRAEIKEDGSIIDTVTVSRKHNGGNTPYDWWNKVNADYIRLYVPKGSRLLSVQGNTRESMDSILDYGSLDFEIDSDVANENEKFEIDKSSGVKIYDESEKTVFAGWVYVEPQESVTVEYKYILPFNAFYPQSNEALGKYSLLVQKQSGSRGSGFKSKIILPPNFQQKWLSSAELREDDDSLNFSGNLSRDKFLATVFQKN